MIIRASPPPPYQLNPIVVPSQLPPSYTCTVYKRGYVKLKKELEIGGTREKHRPWRKVYFELRGTVLEVRKKEKTNHSLCTISMLKAYCGVAVDYYKKDNVLRLRLDPTKEQYLIQPIGDIFDIISWCEHLQAAANISADLDCRRMPKLFTLSRGNYGQFERHQPEALSEQQQRLSRSRAITILVGKTEAVLPVLKCQLLNKSISQKNDK
ncbi:hypothetical protein BDF20DRAFT_913286 [Mycotypha africana]|uniref:uncharacterized protein n=1 Tax=Mycotypha africana TaxID=64632 RepID=UPI002300CE61|nr:uncharacterized protein BDF20DRAFT_913286 [Mycotypha africana]KAI8979776.1 hypothetical protein BDF20DRAFT_913286 [Mycotypha africana]